jgi:HD superfamily phosphohydrolase
VTVSKPKRIYDPIHRFIELEAGEVALLELPVVQRMRRLRQLGLAYLAFPSAEHSRFSHALGALAIGTRVFDALFAGVPSANAQRRLLRASLLLHDLGHGPFSHASEAALGIKHEARTRAILALPDVRGAIEALEVDPAAVLALITGTPDADPVLRELVSGPNLDADRMDYLLRDAYFTGVAVGTYDVEQLVASLRVIEGGGRPVLGIDGRGMVALESFVLARYMMFATVYFHHTTRAFERILQDALREIWPDPSVLDPIEEFLAWDDFRVLDTFRTAPGAAAHALREREKLYGVAAEFNAERDLSAYEACLDALLSRYGESVWADAQDQLLHRLPLLHDSGAPTVWVKTHGGLVDAVRASDVIAKLSGRAYWRKLFVRRDEVDLAEARELCRRIVGNREARLETAPLFAT